MGSHSDGWYPPSEWARGWALTGVTKVFGGGEDLFFRGAMRSVIEERRRKFSSLVGMGLDSLGFFLEGIERSFQRIEEMQWH